jgi:hypothetical protein
MSSRMTQIGWPPWPPRPPWTPWTPWTRHACSRIPSLAGPRNAYLVPLVRPDIPDFGNSADAGERAEDGLTVFVMW